MIMRSIPEFNDVTVSRHNGTVTMCFRWGLYGWNVSGDSEAACINKMVEHFTKRGF